VADQTISAYASRTKIFFWRQIKDAEGLASEVSRLRKAGEQLASVLTELEQVRTEGQQKLEAKSRELQHFQGALAAAEADRQAASTRVAVVEAELSQLESRVRSCEEARWRAGMELAKAKAEADWRHKADQERNFFVERLKEELERAKGKLIRCEMRKLKLEESLEEALMELRGKKREIEQVKARVEGLVRLLQVHVRKIPRRVVLWKSLDCLQ
jgi:chromosome segregation ATPase